MTREDLIRIARDARGGLNRPENERNPMKYDPPEWLLDALRAAYRVWLNDAFRFVDPNVRRDPADGDRT